MKPKVLVTRRLSDSALALLKDYDLDIFDQDNQAIPRQELLSRVSGVDAILCMLTDRIDKELIDAAGPNLKVVSTMSVGFDHIDVETLNDRGILIGNTPDVLNDSVADLTIALMLNAGRRISESVNAVKAGEWGTWSPYWLTGNDLSYATVGIIGLGAIGTTVAKRLKGFECNVIYNSRNRKPELEEELGIRYVELDELLSDSDFVSIHSALTPDTEKMCNQDMFSKMKSSAVFVNTSRGGLVDQDDLYEALVNNKIYSAGLDVTTPEPLPTDSPLLSLNNCTVLPHIGSASIRTRNKMADLAVNNLIDLLNGREIRYQVK